VPTRKGNRGRPVFLPFTTPDYSSDTMAAAMPTIETNF
jgi:hypothetical protein